MTIQIFSGNDNNQIKKKKKRSIAWFDPLQLQLYLFGGKDGAIIPASTNFAGTTNTSIESDIWRFDITKEEWQYVFQGSESTAYPSIIADPVCKFVVFFFVSMEIWTRLM